MRKFLRTALVGGCAMLMVACGNETEKETKEPEMPTYEVNQKFRFGNWGVPPHENSGYMEYSNNPNYCTAEHWQNMKDCGFNLAIPTGGFDIPEIRRDLAMAEEVGMDILVRDRTTNGFETIINLCKTNGYDYRHTYEELEKKAEGIKANIEIFKQYKSFIGITAYDEPSMDYYPIIAACQDWFYKYYPEYEFYTNLLPVYATPKQLCGDLNGKGYNYEDYVREFAEDVNPSVLSYDHYPILTDYDESLYIKEDFMYNLNVFAQQAKKSRVGVNIYLQVMGFYSNAPVTQYEEFAWQVYTSLAFGVIGINIFEYWTQLQAEELNNVRGGIVERDGTINPIYYEVQKVFNQIKDMEDIYLNYKWNGVKTYEGGRVINDQFSMVYDQLEELKEVSKVHNDQDIVVGEFKKGNSYAYMVTNASSPWNKESAHVELTIDDYDYAIVVKQGQREMVKLDKNVLKIDVPCGEGYFIVPVK